MNLLFKSVTIADPNAVFNRQKTDVLVKDGKIARIATDIQTDAEIIDGKGCYLAPGFFDLNCNFGELGLETKEDMQTGTLAASAGGFTGVALMPNMQPAVHSKSEVQYLLNQSRGNLVNVYPLGAISHKTEGKDLAELYDMYSSGALAFTDGNRPVQDAGLMERALLYAQGFEGLIFSYPEDLSIAGKAKVHEGVVSTLLGMKGIPALAEELMISRDLYLAEYTNSKLHFTTISTAQAVEQIRNAKAKGLKVTCDVAAHHLVLTDEALMGFDSLYKVKPPLRTQEDVDALLQGLRDGTIDAIVSQHTPHETELKEVEFEVAEFGMIGLQTTFSLAVQSGLDLELIVEKMAINPRKILGIKEASVNEGETANLVLLDPETTWNYTRENNLSKSYNSPFIGSEMKGKVLLTINNNQIYKSA
ncbi:dihydroorotase [Mucilaginibacter arboris]|uniref:Amidohydrolase family protein n=1 Tax=Mucilaginibacter arboris TaxID=2682090 RepID=A0A7K1SUY2_9SPHI|nr:dihydroorotase [Mucilaginibacter arboris]MVN21094.1 amidohydrolase family protein [Mucilaginibacter arboris]